MTHIVGGYPDLETSAKLIELMDAAGTSFIEVQIPFSDPVADGPTIMAANQQALANGTTPEDCFKLINQVTPKIKTPILIMTYYNIAFKYGLKEFCQRAQAAGVYGLIIPDIPLEEESYEHYLQTCQEYGLHAIQIVSPITPPERLAAISEVASGFVYCVARTGTTGATTELANHLDAYMARVKEHIKLPLALGFGISSPEQARQAAEYGDIVVIGSKVLNLYNQTEGSEAEKLAAVKTFLDATINQ